MVTQQDFYADFYADLPCGKQKLLQEFAAHLRHVGQDADFKKMAHSLNIAKMFFPPHDNFRFVKDQKVTCPINNRGKQHQEKAEGVNLKW